ncbi:PREDICTED: classical arabinogalactan protein 26-like [Erythranthe guttata]|uniref:classical arabinogalactan protein 26-like n=1 Tax=Erythranthe guttata TaxID=4155 RepID=UPI00064DA54B|nr:PREDICTED: classical arabinogalactan protein 26-like [Erythranthe guttata]|eukprot:XP_012827954.1 PREDICTED: classical arabinogalactan protein 26-like [Erythranthe guttata]
MATYLNFLAAAILTVITIFTSLIIPSYELITTLPDISAAPALLPDPPTSPYIQELSPDIAPLLPSSGGPTRSSTGSSMPTIPSTRTPNPDTVSSIGPDTALAPAAGPLQDSSAQGVGVQVSKFCRDFGN